MGSKLFFGVLFLVLLKQGISEAVEESENEENIKKFGTIVDEIKTLFKEAKRRRGEVNKGDPPVLDANEEEDSDDLEVYVEDPGNRNLPKHEHKNTKKHTKKHHKRKSTTTTTTTFSPPEPETTRFSTSQTSTVTTAAPTVTTHAPTVTTHAPTVTTQAPIVTTQAPIVTTQAPIVTTGATGTTAESGSSGTTGNPACTNSFCISTSGSFDIQLSPNGNRITIESFPRGGGTVTVSNPDGSAPVKTNLPVGTSVMIIPTSAGNIQITIGAVAPGAATTGPFVVNIPPRNSNGRVDIVLPSTNTIDPLVTLSSSDAFINLTSGSIIIKLPVRSNIAIRKPGC